MNSSNQRAVAYRQWRLHACLVVLAAGAGVWYWRRQRYAGTGRTSRLWKALNDSSASFAYIADICVRLSSETRAYVLGESAVRPASLDHLVELASSPQVLQAVKKLADTFKSSNDVTLVDQVSGVVLSDRGQDLVSLVVATSTTRAVQVLADAWQRQQQHGDCDDVMERTIASVTDPRVQQVLCRCVSQFVSKGVTVYCQETAGMNTYDDFMVAVSKPKHLAAAKELMRTYTYTAVTTIAQCIAGGEAEPISCKKLEPNGHGQLMLENGTSASLSGKQNGKNGKVNGSSCKHGPTNGMRDPAKETACGSGPSEQWEWLRSVGEVCASGNVRGLCVDMARAAWSGAAGAALDRAATSSWVQTRNTAAVCKAVLIYIIVWLLLLPIFTVCLVLKYMGVV